MPQGPGPITDNNGFIESGAIEAIATDVNIPNIVHNPSNIYVGTVNGGIWHTTNATYPPPGITPSPYWAPLTDQYPSLSIGAVAFSPLDPSENTLFAGTAQAGSYSRGVTGPLTGLLKTTDAGRTWSQLGSLAGANIRTIVPTTIIDSGTGAGQGGQVVLVATYDQGLLRSTDGGLTFPASNISGLPSGGFTDLVADPSDNMRYYAAVAGGGVFRSDNAGATWKAVNAGVPAFASGRNIRLALHSDPAHNVVYAAVDDTADDTTNVFYSTTEGSGWTPMQNVDGVREGGDLNHLFMLSFAADPNDFRIVYIAGNNGGPVERGNIQAQTQWADITNGGVHADSRRMVFDGSGSLLESDDGGLYRLRSPSQSDQWEPLDGDMQNTELMSAAYDRTNRVVIAGAQDNNAEEQSAPGISYWIAQGGGDGGVVAVDNSDPNTTFRYLREGGCGITNIHRITVRQNDPTHPDDHPLTLSGLRDPADSCGSFVLNALPGWGSHMLIANYGSKNGGLYESEDWGDTLTDITGPLAFQGGDFNLTTVDGTDFVYGGSSGGVQDPGLIYIGVNTSQLWVRDSFGSTFRQLNTFQNTGVVHIAVDPADWHTLYVTDGFGVYRGVYQPASGTVDWKDITSNLFEFTGSIRTLEVMNHSNVPGRETVLVGGLGGVFRCGNSGSGPDGVWARVGANLPNTIVADLRYDSVSDTLLAATFGRGAWLLPNASVLVNTPPTLQVNVDDNGVGSANTIVLRLHPGNRNLIQVLVNDQVQYDNFYYPFSNITLNAGFGHDTIKIEDIPAGIAVTANDAVTVNVGKAGTMVGIQGTLTVSNIGFTDLTVDDHLDLLPRNVTIDAGSIQSSAWGSIFYEAEDLHSLTIYGGLAIFPLGSPNGNVFTITDTPNNPYLSLVTTVDTGPGKDVVNVQGATGALVVNGGFAVHIGDPIHHLSGMGPITVNGNGTTTLEVDDGGNFLTGIGASAYLPVLTQYVVAAQQLTRSATLVKVAGPPSDPPIRTFSSTINYTGLAGLTVAGGQVGAYTYQVNSTAGANSVTINAASPADSVTVGDASDNLSTIGTLTVQGNGNTTLKVDDSGNLLTVIGSSVYLPVSTQYAVGAQQLTRSATLVILAGPPFDPPIQSLSSTINYSGLNGLTITGGPLGVYSYQVNSTGGTKNLTISGGPVPNTFTVEGTSAGTSTTINAGSKADVITVGGADNSLDPIQGSITVKGQGGSDTLTVNDQGSSAAHTYTLTDGSLSRTGAAVITYVTLGTLTVSGGSGGNTFQLQTTAAGPLTTLNSGAGDDTFVFTDQAVVRGMLDGQGGYDTLDYRAYTTPAFVNLLTGTATGVTGGVRNIENVLGAIVVYTVTNTDDSGTGSLRQAILDANARPGLDMIVFKIPGSGVQTISPASPLPDITDPVIVDGYSQPGASPNTLAVGDNARLLIQVDGSNAGLGANGLHLTAGGSTVQGLDITHFKATGAPTYQGGVAILLDTNGGDVVQGNFLGTDPAGSAAMGNTEGVIALQGAFSNTIGGTTPAARNLISGNVDGFFGRSGATTASQGNMIEGNYVGLNAAGAAALSNTEDGVDPSSYDTIGGTAPGAGNVISGNARMGMGFFGSDVVVQGNRIGTDATGTHAIGNNWGIFAFQSEGNMIGGTTGAARNVVSGNITGIEIAGNYAHDNVVQGNYIGTNAAGTAAVGNVYDGVFIAFSSSNTVAENVISGNGLHGVDIANSPGFDAANNVVQGNFIGSDATGAFAVGNAGDGVHIYAGAHDTQIGAPPTGSVAGYGNTIAFNGGAGVAVVDATSVNNSIRGNSIHNNGGLGIDLGNDGVTLNGPSPRSGPNNLQNFPVLQVAGLVAGGTGVVGSLDSLPGTAYTVDFYATSADPSGYGQGQTYLGSKLVLTDGSGHAAFALLLPAVAPGSVLTATATDPTGNTSEFSADTPLQPLADLDLDAFGALRYTAAPGLANNLTIALARGAYTFHDTSEPIFVTGAGSAGFAGTGTNLVTGPAAGIGTMFVTGSQTNLTIDDSADAAPHNATAYAGGVSGVVPAPVNWLSSQISALTVSVGSGGNTFTIPGTGPFPTTLNSGAGNDSVYVQATSGSLTVNGVAGSDTVILGSRAPVLGGTLANLLGTVQVGNQAGSTSVLLDDSGDSTGQSLGISNQAVYLFGLAHPLLNYTAGQAKALTVLGGRGDDTFAVPNSVAGISLSLDGGPGSNTLSGPNTANTWQITGPNQGSLGGSVTFGNMQTLIGGTQADTFAFRTGGRLDGTLTDTGGVNTLDYSAYTGDIIVDLALGLATGVAGGAGGGVYHIANVIGSIGNDLLVGDASANVVVGGTGRNVIIGGGGGDTLTGGGGDNILIGGTTAYDTNRTALLAILSEWTRTDRNFHQRTDDLRNGTGLNGSYVLNADPTLGPVTLFDDGLADVLTGGGGSSWFVYHKANDTIKNRKPGDLLTQV
jgi:parallel beta-helix repeat protein